MATVSSGLYKITYRIDYLDKICKNIWWYYENGGDDNVWNDLGDAFDSVSDQIAQCMISDASILTARIDSVFSGNADQFYNFTATAGTQTGTPLPSFVASSINLARTETVTRSGWKRLPGLGEEFVTDNTIVGSIWTELQDLAAIVDDQISSGGKSFTPCIVRVPDTGLVAPATVNVVRGGSAKSRVTTQNTRKTF